MKVNFIEATARAYARLDKRLSYDVALSEAILRDAIVWLDNRGKIKKEKIVDKSK